MTYGAEYWGPPLIAGASSWLSGQGQAEKETKMQKKKRKLVDDLLASMEGDGPFSDLFKADQQAFQQSFVEPAQQMFRDQVAPQIQQEYIASGQQRGTGLDDTLTRAGVDLNSNLNKQYYQFQQDALNRKQSSMDSILRTDSGAPNKPSGWQDIMSAAGGYLASNDFADQWKDYFKKPINTTAGNADPARKGFEA